MASRSGSVVQLPPLERGEPGDVLNPIESPMPQEILDQLYGFNLKLKLAEKHNVKTFKLVFKKNVARNGRVTSYELQLKAQDRHFYILCRPHYQNHKRCCLPTVQYRSTIATNFSRTVSVPNDRKNSYCMRAGLKAIRCRETVDEIASCILFHYMLVNKVYRFEEVIISLPPMARKFDNKFKLNTDHLTIFIPESNRNKKLLEDWFECIEITGPLIRLEINSPHYPIEFASSEIVMQSARRAMKVVLNGKATLNYRFLTSHAHQHIIYSNPDAPPFNLRQIIDFFRMHESNCFLIELETKQDFSEWDNIRNDYLHDYANVFTKKNGVHKIVQLGHYGERVFLMDKERITMHWSVGFNEQLLDSDSD